MTALAALLLPLVGVAGPLASPAGGGPPETPNIVVILADDLGWAEVGYHGSDIPTPNLDAFVRAGVELDRFYVAAVCSPTRAGLLTGRYPIRFGMMRAVVKPWLEHGLPDDEVTLPQFLETAGYAQRGIFGKWHLGHLRREWHPLEKGFTRFVGALNGGIDYRTHECLDERDWHDGFDPNFEDGYATDLIAEHSSAFIRKHAPEDEPYFAYVPFNAPHKPFAITQTTADCRAAYQEAVGEHEESQRSYMAAMVISMDRGIGRILDAIRESGDEENTLVLFLSDNGGAGDVMLNDPLRGGKGEVFEGGIRVPAAIRWPRVIPGGRKLTTPLSYIDVFPTLAAILGRDAHGGKPFDGVDVLPILTGERKTLERELYSYAGKHEQAMVMEGGWKLVTDDTGGRYLFHIEDDPLEEVNRVTEHSDLAKSLSVKLQAFRDLQPENAIPRKPGEPTRFRPPPEWWIRPDRDGER